MAIFHLNANRFRSVLAASSLLLLAACAGAAEGPASTPGAAAPAFGEAAPRPPSAPGVPPPREPSVAIAPALPTPATPPRDVQRLIGLKGEALRQWMGDTVFVRHDGIAEIWRFATDTCFLDVFLYRERDGLRVAHLDARTRNGNQRAVPQTCYGSILAGRKKPPSS